MEGVTISKYGLAFVPKVLRGYLGQSLPILLVFLAGMIVYTIIMAGRVSGASGKQDSFQESGATKMNWAVLIVLVLTLYNPFAVKAIVPKLGMTPVYYRTFWVLPIIFGAAYYLTLLVSGIRKKAVSGLVLAAVTAAAAVFMPVNPGIRYHLSMPDNLYKVSGSVPVICDAIHEDFEQTDQYQKKLKKAEGTDRLTKRGARRYVRTLPRCVFPYEIEFQVRPYDPSITLTFPRDMRLSYEGSKATGVDYSGWKAFTPRKTILDAMYGRDDAITPEALRKALKRTKTNYLIVEENLANTKLLKDAGCTLVTAEAGYDIYSWGLTRAKDAG